MSPRLPTRERGSPGLSGVMLLLQFRTWLRGLGLLTAR